MTLHHVAHPFSPRPVCPAEGCGKVWAPTRKAAQELVAEIRATSPNNEQLKYYEHAGGWHWSRRIDRVEHDPYNNK